MIFWDLKEAAWLVQKVQMVKRYLLQERIGPLQSIHWKTALYRQLYHSEWALSTLHTLLGDQQASILEKERSDQIKYIWHDLYWLRRTRDLYMNYKGRNERHLFRKPTWFSHVYSDPTRTEVKVLPSNRPTSNPRPHLNKIVQAIRVGVGSRYERNAQRMRTSY